MKWHAVACGQHRHHVGADLVGDVAVGRDPVGADDHQIDATAGEQLAGGAVGQQGHRDAVAL